MHAYTFDHSSPYLRYGTEEIGRILTVNIVTWNCDYKATSVAIAIASLTEPCNKQIWLIEPILVSANVYLQFISFQFMIFFFLYVVYAILYCKCVSSTGCLSILLRGRVVSVHILELLLGAYLSGMSFWGVFRYFEEEFRGVGGFFLFILIGHWISYKSHPWAWQKSKETLQQAYK
jgi:hypothetical protein